MQDMSPTHAATEHPSAAVETPVSRAKRLCVEVLLRAWATAKRSEPITHRAVQAILESVRLGCKEVDSLHRTTCHMSVNDPAAELSATFEVLKSHNAVWRCVEVHPGAQRIPGMKPRGFRLNAKKLMATSVARSEHGALYEALRDAAKTM